MHLPKLLLRFTALLCLVFTGCDYEAPLTAQPTGPIDDRLLGQWISPDAWMKVSRFDDRHYVVVHNGHVYRAWHSTSAGLPLITVQSIESPERKYAFLSAAVSSENNRLALRVVRDEVISKKLTSAAEMQKAIKEHRDHPGLLSDEVPFARMK